MIALEDVRFAWPRDRNVLDIAELKIARGERLLITGPSGTGKSTLLGLLGGVLAPQSGAVTVLDRDLTRLRASQRDRFRADHIGIIFQLFNLLPYLSVLDNVRLPLRFSETRRKRAGTETARSLLAALGIQGDAMLNRSATALSVGQQQRVAAARALIGRPELIIADEPSSALDGAARDALMSVLSRECASNDTALICVSHDPQMAPHFDRVVALAEINRA